LRNPNKLPVSDVLGKIYPNVKKFALSQAVDCNDRINVRFTHIPQKSRPDYPQSLQITRVLYPLAIRTYGRLISIPEPSG
jgi:hypothetical protein